MIVSEHIFSQLREYQENAKICLSKAEQCRKDGNQINEDFWLYEAKFWQSSKDNILHVIKTGGLTCGER